jgi:hypothetical protein
MKYISLLIPNFLSRIDNHLMLHTPHIWRTRVHFVAFYAFIAWILLFFIGLLYPLSMFDISRTPYAVEEIKHVSFLFLLICGFFGLVYWWQQVAKFRILAAKWYHSFMECALFFVGIFMLWQAVNAFQNGLDTNMAYRVGRVLSEADREKLYRENFYLPAVFDFNNEIELRKEFDWRKDTSPYQYYTEAEALLQTYHNRLHRAGVIQDSQFLIRKENRFSESRYEGDFGFYHPSYSGDSYIYSEWKDSINTKAKRVIKPYPQRDDIWSKKLDKYVEHWKVQPFNSYDAWTLDSIYQFLNAYDKFQVDSVRYASVNESIDGYRKQQQFPLTLLAKGMRKVDIEHVLDTCSNVFFNNQQWTYLDVLKSENQRFESEFRDKQILSTFSAKDSVAYKNYLAEIMLIAPLSNRKRIDIMEVGLYYKKDSLTLDFFGKVSKRGKRNYEDLMAFYMNNTIKKEKAAEYVSNIRWNKKTSKYSEIEKYVTRDFLDTVFFYADSLISRKKKARFDQVYSLLNYSILQSIHSNIDDWKSNKDTFLILDHYVQITFFTKKENKYRRIVDRKMRRDSIPLDTVFKWEIEKNLQYNLSKNEVDNLFEDKFFTNYKKYRDTKITTEDSTFLDNVYTKTGYLRDSSEHSRLFFHANAYYLYLADISINKSRAFLTGWNPFYLSTNNKLAIIVLAFLMFFTTLAYSNLFTAIFAAFFINFVNNTLFNMGQNFQEVDKNKQTFWLFGLLAVLALITAFNVLFRKFKLPVIYLLINVQLFAMLGIFVWLFDSQTIEQQSNYAYLAVAFWGLMVWKFRSYLALPSKR